MEDTSPYVGSSETRIRGFRLTVVTLFFSISPTHFAELESSAACRIGAISMERLFDAIQLASQFHEQFFAFDLGR